MAEEKTILTVDLYDNVLTEKAGDYTGKIRVTGTTRTSDISNRIVKKRTEYRPETITNILDLSYDEMIEALAQGRCVVNKFGQWLLTINGSFDGKKSDFRSTENKITVMFTPSATLLKALKHLRERRRSHCGPDDREPHGFYHEGEEPPYHSERPGHHLRQHAAYQGG